MTNLTTKQVQLQSLSLFRPRGKFSCVSSGDIISVPSFCQKEYLNQISSRNSLINVDTSCNFETNMLSHDDWCLNSSTYWVTTSYLYRTFRIVETSSDHDHNLEEEIDSRSNFIFDHAQSGSLCSCALVIRTRCHHPKAPYKFHLFILWISILEVFSTLAIRTRKSITWACPLKMGKSTLSICCWSGWNMLNPW